MSPRVRSGWSRAKRIAAVPPAEAPRTNWTGLDRPGPGVARMQAVVTRMVEALAAELPRSDYALAAE